MALTGPLELYFKMCGPYWSPAQRLFGLGDVNISTISVIFLGLEERNHYVRFCYLRVFAQQSVPSYPETKVNTAQLMRNDHNSRVAQGAYLEGEYIRWRIVGPRGPGARNYVEPSAWV